jgi:hypothetical protein
LDQGFEDEVAAVGQDPKLPALAELPEVPPPAQVLVQGDRGSIPGRGRLSRLPLEEHRALAASKGDTHTRLGVVEPLQAQEPDPPCILNLVTGHEGTDPGDQVRGNRHPGFLRGDGQAGGGRGGMAGGRLPGRVNGWSGPRDGNKLDRMGRKPGFPSQRVPIADGQERSVG